jgi:hypothetical protein
MFNFGLIGFSCTLGINAPYFFALGRRFNGHSNESRNSLINFLAGGFLFYILSQTIDQRWWKGLPGEEAVFVPLEELIEIFGHCTVGFGLLFSKQVRQSDNHTTG